MKKLTILSTVTAAVALSAAMASSLQAKLALLGNAPAFDLPSASVVTPNDTFILAIAGFNSAETNTGVYLIQPLTVTFTGTGAQTFTGVGPGGQNVTVTTTQTTSGGNVTDSIAVSVPTNFVPTGTTTSSGAVINQIEFDMGGGFAGTNTLDFTPAIPGTPTYTGSIIYGAANNTLALTPTATLSNGQASLAFIEGVNTTSTAGLSQFAIKTFNFSTTYAAVPEPSTCVFFGVGALALGLVIVRRHRRQAA